MFESGLEMERLRMVNIGAADAHLFAEIMKDMFETVRTLGPVNLKKLAIAGDIA
jgi:coenzyme F420-reducing hydrogenase delta subunit